MPPSVSQLRWFHLCSWRVWEGSHAPATRAEQLARVSSPAPPPQMTSPDWLWLQRPSGMLGSQQLDPFPYRSSTVSRESAQVSWILYPPDTRSPC